MDAREILANSILEAGKNMGALAPQNGQTFEGKIVEFQLQALTAAGFTIIHRDENHGPTLERAARVAGRIYAQDAFHFELGTACASAIRAMGEKK